MTFQRRDRREWGLLGLAVLAYGLGLAPVVHAALQHGDEAVPTDSDGAWLSHSAPSSPRPRTHGHSHTHAAGSVEHVRAVAPAVSPPPRVARVEVQVVQAPSGSERAAFGERARPRAMPQGP